MRIVETYFQDKVLVLAPRLFHDSRGYFQESFNRKIFASLGITDDFMQDNHSYNKNRGTLRGLHYQSAPMAQSKLVRVVNGAALDVVVDIREDSSTFGQYKMIEINDENLYQIYIPKGFAHGFYTLSDNCHFTYKVSNYYSHENNKGIIWNDSTINIPWPENTPFLSDQDKLWPTLKEITPFEG